MAIKRVKPLEHIKLIILKRTIKRDKLKKLLIQRWNLIDSRELIKVELNEDIDVWCIKAKIEGVDCNLMIDTGSFTNVLSSEFALTTSLGDKEVVHERYLSGINGHQDARMAAFIVEGELQIANMKIKDYFDVSPGIDTSFKNFNNNVQGIIGHKLLKKLRAIIDYNKKVLYFCGDNKST